MAQIKNPERQNLKMYAALGDWTPDKLRETRIQLGLSQKDIGELVGMTGAAVSFLERGQSANLCAIPLYGIILERYWAGIHGYVPAFRKIGESTFMEEAMMLQNSDAAQTQ